MSATGSSKQLATGEVFAGKFRLERQFASGGMGSVWRAWNMQLDIPVAVKVMAGAMADSPDFVVRFEREARAAAQIRSPHVVNIYEHGVHEHLPYMVMELLEGEDLSQRLKRDKRLSMVATAKIVRDMCKALNRAHELGIVHRDIKPANVFLARNGDEEIVKVLDFGIAKVTQPGGASITATGEMMGTPSYMSPEHIRASKHVDHRADLWSVSVIAFRTLTGQLPFTGQILDLVDQILSGSAPIPSSLVPDLSPAVDAFFSRALARDIGQRFQSARELADALGRLVGRESRIDPSLLPDSPRESGEMPTIAALRPAGSRPAIPIAPEPETAEPDVGTVLIPGRGSRAEPAAAPPAAESPRKQLMRTVPMDSAPMIAAARALAEAKARADADAASQAAESQRKGFLATLPLDTPPMLEAAKALAEAQVAAQAQIPAQIPAAAAASPWVGPAPKGAVTAPGSRPVSRLVWVAVAAVLVVIAAAFWASSYLRKGQSPAPLPSPAASAP